MSRKNVMTNEIARFGGLNFFSLINLGELIVEYIIGFAQAWVGLWEFKKINGNARKEPLFSMFNEIGFL